MQLSALSLGQMIAPAQALDHFTHRSTNQANIFANPLLFGGDSSSEVIIIQFFFLLSWGATIGGRCLIDETRYSLFN